MPITQATLLAVYGEVSRIADAIEKTLDIVHDDPALDLASTTGEALYTHLNRLRRISTDAQREALKTLMRDDPTIHANPITGRIE